MITEFMQEVVKRISRLEYRLDGLPRYEFVKNNFTATAAPGVGDDSNDGYSVGSQWVNTTADDAYTCCDATVGAAVWKKTTP